MRPKTAASFPHQWGRRTDALKLVPTLVISGFHCYGWANIATLPSYIQNSSREEREKRERRERASPLEMVGCLFLAVSCSGMVGPPATRHLPLWQAASLRHCTFSAPPRFQTMISFVEKCGYKG